MHRGRDIKRALGAKDLYDTLLSKPHSSGGAVPELSAACNARNDSTAVRLNLLFPGLFLIFQTFSSKGRADFVLVCIHKFNVAQKRWNGSLSRFPTFETRVYGKFPSRHDAPLHDSLITADAANWLLALQCVFAYIFVSSGRR